MAQDFFIQVNHVDLHYIDHGGDGPLFILLHGLTANAHAFDGLMARGLGKSYRVICPDLRGNGLSGKPAFCYSVEDHVQDILALIAHLGEKQVYLGGHSFGGYLSFYLSANYATSVSRLVVLDAAKAMNANTPEMLASAISRLDATYPSFDAYIEQVRKAPYLDTWDPAMLSYYKADVGELQDGSVQPHGNAVISGEKSLALAAIDWSDTIERIAQPTLLVNALDNYTLGEPLLPDFIAKETAADMQDARYQGVDGNHLTMLYGHGAEQTVAHIKAFLPASDAVKG